MLRIVELELVGGPLDGRVERVEVERFPEALVLPIVVDDRLDGAYFLDERDEDRGRGKMVWRLRRREKGRDDEG